MLGLRFCARAFPSCGEWGPLFIAVRGPLTVTASLVAEHRLQTRRLSSCGSRAQLLHGTWDLPRPGLEPVSPALAGGFSTTAPPGKPPDTFLIQAYHGDIVGLVPDYCNKVNIAIEQVTQFFWSPSAYKSYIYIIMQAIKCAIASCLKNVHTLIKKYFIAKTC